MEYIAHSYSTVGRVGTDTECETLDAAKKECLTNWDHLTWAEKQKNECCVIKSVNPDETAENHFDGSVVFLPYDRKDIVEICVGCFYGCHKLIVPEMLGSVTYDAVLDALRDGESKWNAAPCDPEGPTPEQDAVLDKIIDDTVDVIIDVLNAHGITVATKKAGA